MSDISPKKLLILGMAGGLARITTGLLLKRFPDLKIVGIDSRPMVREYPEDRVNYLRIKYTRGNFEKVFRDHDFDSMLHLGRLSHAQSGSTLNLAQRLDLNLMGTKRILDLCLKYKLKKVVVLSTFHVYGALKDNPTFISEDSSLRASIKYPELRDVVEMDQLVSGWMWKNQKELSTVILRPCNILGPQINNTMTRYLTANYAPVPVDFNPMLQFVHEFDMAHSLAESISHIPTGIYNVAPSDAISVREAKRIIGLPTIPVPIFLLESMARGFNTPFWSFPHYLLDYIKFPCVIDGRSLHKELKQPFRFSIRETLELLKDN